MKSASNFEHLTEEDQKDLREVAEKLSELRERIHKNWHDKVKHEL